MEFTGTQVGQPMHFLQMFLVSDTAAVVATLTTTPETFPDVRAAVEPYLLTLQFEECPTKQFSCAGNSLLWRLHPPVQSWAGSASHLRS